MHRFWDFDELLWLFLEHLSLISRADAARFSRTCKRMFVFGLPVIWEKPSMRVLARLLEPLPKGFLAKLGKLVWGDESVHTNWLGPTEPPPERLRFYCVHVKHLEIVEIAGRTEDFYAVLSAILSLEVPLSELFPKLQSLAITVGSPEFAAQAFRLALPSMSFLSLTISVLTLNEDVPGSRYADFLPHMMSLPRLDSLEMYGRATTSSAEAAFLQVTADQFPTLQAFSALIMLVDALFIPPLSQLHRLETLDIQLGKLPWSSTTTPCVLPALAVLSVTYTRISDMQHLLQTLTASPSLCELKLKSNAIPITGAAAAGNTSAYRALCGTISASWPGLRVFSLSGFPEIVTGLTRPTPWDWDAFAPLLACNHIHTFTIQTPIKVNVSDADLRDIGDAWPGLCDLALAIPEGRVVEAPRATVRGLVYLAAQCKQLENVGLSVSFILPGESDLLVDLKPVSNLSVIRLDVHDCPPCDVPATAELLRNLFPKLWKFRFATRKFVVNDEARDAEDEERVHSMGQVKRMLGL